MLQRLFSQWVWYKHYESLHVPAILWRRNGRMWKVNRAFRQELSAYAPVDLNALWHLWFSKNAGSFQQLAKKGRSLPQDPFLFRVSVAPQEIKTFKVMPLPLLQGWVSVFYEQKDESTLDHLFLKYYPLPYVVVSAKGEVLSRNQAFDQWLGYEDDAWTQLRFWSLLVSPPEDLEAAQKKTCGFRSAQGHVKHAYFFCITHLPKETVAFLLVPHPVSLNRLVPEALFLELLPMPAAILEEGGKLGMTNASFQDVITPHCSTSILSDHIRSQDLTTFRSFLRQAQKDKGLPPTFHVHWNDGASHSLSAQLFAGRRGTQKSLLLLFYEPRTFAPLEAQTVEAQKLQALGQLASGIIHDFNNLLTGILGFCDLLLQRHRASDPSFHDIQQIHENANRAANLSRQLLLFVRQMPSEPQSVAVSSCLERLVSLLKRLLGPRIILRVQGDDHDSTVYCDYSKLEQVLINLAINARDAMSEGGELLFRCSVMQLKAGLTTHQNFLKPGSYIVVEIADTGCGIPAENLDHIFKPFFSTKEAGHGTGLGLATVHQIVTEMQGGITVTSQVDHGTTFAVYLPRYQEKGKNFELAEKISVSKNAKDGKNEKNTSVNKQEPKSTNAVKTSQPKEVSSKALTILLAEDEAPIRQIVSRALHNQGHTVYEVTDGQEALEFLQQKLPLDLLITDVGLPGVDGPSLANVACGAYPGLDCVFVSGYTEDYIKPQLNENVKKVWFLPKPFRVNDLIELIGKIKS